MYAGGTCIAQKLNNVVWLRTLFAETEGFTALENRT